LPDELTKLQRGREGQGLNHHDEHLFIVVHQAFELWFKQVRPNSFGNQVLTFLDLVRTGLAPQRDDCHG